MVSWCSDSWGVRKEGTRSNLGSEHMASLMDGICLEYLIES